MSILNVSLHADRVFIGVDSIVDHAPLLPGRRRAPAPSPDTASGGLCVKAVYLPGVGALAARGSAGLLSMVTQAAMIGTIGAPLWSGLDALLPKLPEMIRRSTGILVQQARIGGVSAHLVETLELAVAGWSEERQCMHARVLWQESAASGPQTSDLGEDLPTWIAPWDDDHAWPPEPRQPATAEEMHQLAALQVRTTSMLGIAGFGGRSIVAELTREGAVFTERSLH